MSSLKFKGIVFVILLVSSLFGYYSYYVGYHNGDIAGYQRGRTVGIQLGKMSIKKYINDDNFIRCADDYQKLVKDIEDNKTCNMKLAIAMWLMNSKTESEKDVAKVLTPEKVEKEEPTQTEPQEFYVGECNAACEGQGLSPGKLTECLGKCRAKEYEQYECAYMEGEDLKQCKKDAKVAGDEYERELDRERAAGQPTFYDRIGDAVVEKIKESEND